MKIKRFFAKDMKSALQEVKETLGVNAVIMSNKKVVGGIEIVAAVDGEGTQLPQSTMQNTPRQNDRFASLQEDHVQLSSLNRGNPSLGQSYTQISGNESTPNLSSQRRGGGNIGNDRSHTDEFSQIFNRAQAQNEAETSTLSALLKRQQSSLFSDQDQERLLARSTVNRNSPERSYASHSSSFSQTGSQTGSNSYLNMSKPVNRGGSGDLPLKKPMLDPTRYDNKTSQINTQHELLAMREEISSIRQLLQHQVSGLMWQEVERQEPLRAMLIKRLEKMGISPELADQLAGYVPENALPHQVWQSVLSLLKDQLITTKEDIISTGGIIALLGPTGVGKTTTVAKLAAKAAMEHGPDDIALITTDTYRIGAHEQLATYGRILGCPVKVASSSDELNQALYQFRHRRLILLDTAGMGQRDVRLSEQLDNIMKNSGAHISSLLVLAATSQRRVLQETVDHFKQIPLSGCVLTKLDESLSLGELISTTIENALPIAYFADGQRVPEDLQMADTQLLVERANELLEYDLKQDSQFWLDRSPDINFGRS